MERHIKIQGSCIYPQFSYYWYYSFTSKDRDVEGIFERFTSGGGGGITWKRANCASAEGTSFEIWRLQNCYLVLLGGGGGGGVF